jgi:hypothetical protein
MGVQSGASNVVAKQEPGCMLRAETDAAADCSAGCGLAQYAADDLRLRTYGHYPPTGTPLEALVVHRLMSDPEDAQLTINERLRESALRATWPYPAACCVRRSRHERAYAAFMTDYKRKPKLRH